MQIQSYNNQQSFGMKNITVENAHYPLDIATAICKALPNAYNLGGDSFEATIGRMVEGEKPKNTLGIIICKIEEIKRTFLQSVFSGKPRTEKNILGVGRTELPFNKPDGTLISEDDISSAISSTLNNAKKDSIKKQANVIANQNPSPSDEESKINSMMQQIQAYTASHNRN